MSAEKFTPESLSKTVELKVCPDDESLLSIVNWEEKHVPIVYASG